MFPDRRTECALAKQWGRVAGVDEVGRGALAGPVCVGVVIVTESMPAPPAGIRDSKLLSPQARTRLVDPIKEWALGWGVGMSQPWEIDQLGLTAALKKAGLRALEQAGEADVVLLDGKHNWLGGTSLFDDETPLCPVVTEVKADLHCVAVAAASILAKVARDTIMEQAPDPGYHWASNKGYGSKAHRQALAAMGPSSMHRLSWKLR